MKFLADENVEKPIVNMLRDNSIRSQGGSNVIPACFWRESILF